MLLALAASLCPQRSLTSLRLRPRVRASSPRGSQSSLPSSRATSMLVWLERGPPAAEVKSAEVIERTGEGA